MIKYFPPARTVFNQAAAKDRQSLLKEINDLLLSGDPKLDDLGVAQFGPLDAVKKDALVKN